MSGFEPSKHPRGHDGRFGNTGKETVGETALKTSGVSGSDVIEVLSSRVRKYKGATTVQAWVDTHGKGRAHALRELAADQKAGKIRFVAATKDDKKGLPKRTPPDRSKLTPVDSDFQPDDHLISLNNSKKYPPGMTVGEFVDNHPKGKAFAMRQIVADHKAGRLQVERLKPPTSPKPPRATPAAAPTPADWNTKAWHNIDPALAKAIKAAPPVARIPPQPRGGAYYQSLGPQSGAIQMGAYGEKFPGNPDVQNTWRHEFGHHIDYTHPLGGKLPVSTHATAEMSTAGTALIQASDGVATTKAMAYLSGASDADVQKALDKSGVGLSTDELKSIVTDQKNMPRVAASLIAGDAKTFLELTHNHPNIANQAAHGSVSDFVEAITKCRIGGHKAGMIGHGASYYTSSPQVPGSTYHVANTAEPFAQFIALRGGGTSVHTRVLRQFAPALMAKYDRLLETYT